MATVVENATERGEQLKRDGVIIRTYDLWKTYVMGDQEINAVAGIDIQVRKGEYVALMGPSGSGKSTLMNLIGCLDTPSKGTYLLNDKEVSRMTDNELARIRNEEIGFWALSRHADVVEGFRDNVRFSSSHGVSLDPSASGPHAHRTMSFLAMDPPMHGRMRGLVSRGFTPRRVAELEPRIRELTRMHLDGALAKGSFDFIGDLAGKLPMDVISELIGVPAADRDELRRLSDLLVHREEGMDETGIRERIEAAVDASMAAKAANIGPELMRYVEKSMLLQTLDGGWTARAIAVASTLCVMYTRIHALLLIAIGALLLVGVHALGM